MSIMGELELWKRRAEKRDIVLKRGRRGVLVSNSPLGIWESRARLSGEEGVRTVAEYARNALEQAAALRGRLAAGMRFLSAGP